MTHLHLHASYRAIPGAQQQCCVLERSWSGATELAGNCAAEHAAHDVGIHALEDLTVSIIEVPYMNTSSGVVLQFTPALVLQSTLQRM